MLTSCKRFVHFTGMVDVGAAVAAEQIEGAVGLDQAVARRDEAAQVEARLADAEGEGALFAATAAAGADDRNLPWPQRSCPSGVIFLNW
jgi:hypothetical protein